jgi:hypothetical protein
VVEPVEQWQHERRFDSDSLERRSEPRRLRRDDERVDGLIEALGWATNSPRVTLLRRRPCVEMTAVVSARATTIASALPA